MPGVAQQRLAELLKGIAEVPAALDCWVSDIQQDSRKVTSGALFVAAEGVSSNGAQYVEDALARGARAVLLPGTRQHVYEKGDVVFIELDNVRPVVGIIAHRFFGQATHRMKVVGVTGTNGKSSVTHYVAQLAEGMGMSAAVVGTLGYGRPNSLKATTHTTPDAVSLHRVLAELRNEGIELVAMEVSSHALDQDRAAGVNFDVAVLTNITRDHLDYHGTLEAYAEAKKRLFLSDSVRWKVFNQDDPYGARWAQELQGPKTLTFSVGKRDKTAANVCAEDVHFDADGMSFELDFGATREPARLALVGEFNLSNALAACAALSALKAEPQAVRQQMARLTPVTGRMQPLHEDKAPTVVVDYAHTPDALEVALKAARRHCPGRLWCVFGCGGDRDPGKRPLMGAVAAQYADEVVLTDDNPRGEDPESIVAQIVKGVEQGAHFQVVRPRNDAIRFAVEHAAREDVILLAGKGHEDYQEIQGRRMPFSDIEIARDCLASVAGVRGESSSASGEI
ncbi:UDP-N-acetylmuramoyl-L-alanyl-D-glutamate--2,6-diaminopimelate ligase [Hahella sp. KA22]|uniref:UDP-N-acetylmuramoyl-L-alanyl-D-glutamate--2, 6-diaminopimelate ligase n=1 Tax=Hahella sp. KA22 TaxID=1628392 RepID=UPI000FDE4049|nr:UDP-N-acetylmuramoyl-L-alanyl-D-glutamate--2,6-diaminopimelate ligase [Hahella sp. KA22]AZZ90491.1 UDP-N-acetylmuramoyl-L-alanyl-D-glutamate--2,6-diaminopimelate ligase [Hahella sp. KA22]QAY53861.1 UDP-N-acetylmuramoyl-L-alanyl-D-glutamate--2,6-diaminopimelate ligase [Hahella sp. KA22]